MTRNELRTKLEEHVDTYMVFNGASVGVRNHFKQEDWFRNNCHLFGTRRLLDCLFQLVRIKIKNFNYISEERRNDILERDLDEALLCKDLNKILTEMDN